MQQVQPNARTGDTDQPFTWNGAYGYEWIAITGLYHVGAREYDPRTGRWLQRDPIEASSGDPNFWRYCGNDPLNGVDPSGEDWLDFVPFVGSIRDIYEGVRDGDWAQAGVGVLGLAADVATGGGGSLIKGAVKTGVKGVAKTTLKESAETGIETGVKNLVPRPNQIGTSPSFKDPAAKGYDWDHIFDRHSATGKTAQHRKHGTTFPEGMSDEQIKASVKSAWKHRKKKETQKDPCGNIRIDLDPFRRTHD